MREDSLVQLIKLIKLLDENELVVLKTYLNSFDTRGKKYKSKTGLLLKLILENANDESLKPFLKRKLKAGTDDALRMIITRLKDKIGESLLLDMNITREGAYEASPKMRFELAKKLLVAQIYQARGLRQEAIDLYDKVIESSKQFEFYYFLIEAMHLKKHLIGLKHGRKQYDEIDKEAAHYEKCRMALIHALDAYNDIAMNYGFKGLSHGSPDKEFLKLLEEKRAQLQKDFEETKSPLVGYFLIVINVEYYQSLMHLSKADQELKKLVTFVEKNPSVYLKRRLGNAYALLSSNDLISYRFQSSIENSEKSKQSYKVNTVNYGNMMEMEFYGYFYNGEIDKAEQTIKSLIANDKIEKNDFKKSKYNYLLACTYFVQRKFRDAFFVLQDTHEIDQDKEGWNLGIRLLSILIDIEDDNTDHADSLITNYRQFISAALKEKSVRKRDKTIMNLLLELRKQSFYFNKTRDSKPELLDQLRSKDPDLRWIIQSPELIPVHQWFEAKLKTQSFKPQYSEEEIHQEK